MSQSDFALLGRAPILGRDVRRPQRDGASLSPIAASPCVYHITSVARIGETQDKRYWHILWRPAAGGHSWGNDGPSMGWMDGCVCVFTGIVRWI